LENVANCGIEKERTEIANAVKYGKVSLPITVINKDNEEQPRDENGKFLSVVATVASTDNDEQGPSTYSKNIYNY